MPAKINLRDIISVEDEQNLISNFQLGHTIKDLSFAAKLPRHHVYLILERNQIEITNNSIIPMIGKIFGQLTVIREVNKQSNRKMWECHCICGKIIPSICGHDLRSGHTTSCGCAKRSDNPQKTTIGKIFRSDYADGNLLLDDFYTLSQLSCSYCGISPSNLRKYSWKSRPDHYNGGGDFLFNGLDRINNDLPHNLENVITSCCQCNRSRGKNTLDDFITHMQKLYSNFHSKNWIISPILRSELDNIYLNISDIYITPEQKNTKGRGRGKIKYMPQAASISLTLAHYRAADKQINSPFDLLFEDFYKIVLMNCIYCNSEPKTEISIKNTKCLPETIKKSFIKINGLDRIDSNLDHSIGNIVPSCYTCNWMKSNKTLDYFTDWIQRVGTNLQFGVNI